MIVLSHMSSAGEERAEPRAEAREQRLGVAHGLQVAGDRARADGGLVGVEAVVRAARDDRFERRLRRVRCPTGWRCASP